MVMLPEKNFDSSKHDDMNDEFDPIPKGIYPAQVVKSEIKATKAGTGKYIKLEIEIVAGEYKARKIFSNLNIENPNPQAVEIAQKELATLCRAINVLNLQDTNQLHNIPFLISVSVKPAKGDYPPSNKITGYDPYSEKAAGSLPAQRKKQIKTEQKEDNIPSFLKRKREKQAKLDAEENEGEKIEVGRKKSSQEKETADDDGIPY